MAAALRGQALARRRVTRNAQGKARAAPRRQVRARAEDGQQERFKGTAAKALAVNLRQVEQGEGGWTNYGTFAEIGAGQEVARWFFRVGGAAGTVAKSVSAYDMTISDTQYGAAKRYVTRERVESMLEYEYLQCQLPLQTQRGDRTAFFAFADTIAAKSYRGNSECHGWLGLKFQTEPESAPSRIILHVRLLDGTAALQQEATGVLGVNLLHACFMQLNAGDEPHTPEQVDTFLASLVQELGTWDDGDQRIQVDLVRLDGPAFNGFDERAVALRLVERKYCEATIFNTDGSIMLASDLLYKQNVLVQRGLFRPYTKLNEDMLNGASAEFFCIEENGDDALSIYSDGSSKESCVMRDDTTVLLEMTTFDLTDNGDLLDWTSELGLDEKSFLNRLDSVLAAGYPVLLSNFFEYYRISGYLQRAIGKGKGKFAIVLGVPAMKQLFNEAFYSDLEGGLLENFGRLARSDMQLYLYPTVDETGNVITANSLELPEDVEDLYEFLLKRNVVLPVQYFDEELLRKVGPKSVGKKVKDMIEAGDEAWRDFVPKKVAQKICENNLYGSMDSSTDGLDAPVEAGSGVYRF